MKLLNFLIVKLTVCLITGILIAYNFSEFQPVFKYAFLVLLCLFLFEFIRSKTLIKQQPFLGLLTYVTFITLGANLTYLNSHTFQINHYSNLVTHNDKNISELKLYKQLKPSAYHKRYLAKVITVNSKTCKGKILVNIDSSLITQIDDVLLSKTLFRDFSPPKNPHQFKFKNYMSKQDVTHQVYINNLNTTSKKGKTSIYGITNNIRNKIIHNLEKHIHSQDNLAIIKALMLGQRQNLSKDIYLSFSKAGAIHILAISGLHIGIIMLLLNQLFKPLERLKKIKPLIPFIIVLLLWMYALIAGLSASIVRAVTMFSLLTIALYHKRKTSTYNTLFISAFILLLINPYYLFEVGFQLSYLAVFSIVLLKPLFDKLWKPKFYLIKKLYDVFSVSLAAQIGILPLSLFYFHQFPGLFMVSNLVIIPLLGSLLVIGFLVIILAYFNSNIEYLTLFFETCINYLQSFVLWIAHQEGFLFKEISFNQLNLISSYLLIVTLISLLYKFKAKKNILFLSSLLFFTSSLILNKYDHQQKEEFVIFNQYKNTIYGKRIGQYLTFSSKKEKTGNIIKDYVIGEYITHLRKDSLKNIHTISKERILVVDNNGIYQTSFKPTIVYLTQSPKINLNRLIKVIRPKLIIIDNNNYRSYQERWIQTCIQQKIPFHSTNEKGAVVIR